MAVLRLRGWEKHSTQQLKIAKGYAYKRSSIAGESGNCFSSFLVYLIMSFSFSFGVLVKMGSNLAIARYTVLFVQKEQILLIPFGLLGFPFFPIKLNTSPLPPFYQLVHSP